jgi:DoxX-like family
MKRTNILYWSFTGIFAAFMLFSAVPNIMSDEASVELINKMLGYPVYFIPFIGVAKALGSVVLVVPGFNRIKEWAYSGLMFDLVAAIYSLIAVGNGFLQWGFLLLPMLFCALSYYFHHQRLNVQK